MGLPDKDKLVGNPTIGEYKTALGDFYDYVKGLHFWKPSTAVAVGDVVFKSYSNSSVYAKCTVAGVTGTDEPVWGAIGETITDNTVTWEMHEITKPNNAVLADTATKLATAIYIANVLFDGSTSIDIPYSNLTDKPTIPTVPSIASQAQAVAGTNNATIITPQGLRYGLNASGNAPVFACRAWVNFDGSGNIRASGNVSSVTRNSAGDYTINFTTALLDANYAPSIISNGGNTWNHKIVEMNANYFRFLIEDGGTDYSINTVTIIR